MNANQRKKKQKKQGRPGNEAISYLHVNVHVHVWRSRVEIEGYSVANFDFIAVFEVPYC